MSFGFEYSVKLGGLPKLRRVFEEDLFNNGQGPVGRALEKWGDIYFGYLFRRFNLGGGSRPWTPLSEKTIKRKGHASILIDTYTLRNAFHPANRTAQIRERMVSGMSFGLRQGPHPKSRLGVKGLAMLHHYGRGNLPARPIFVSPDQRTKQEMADAMRAGIQDLVNQTGVGRG